MINSMVVSAMQGGFPVLTNAATDIIDRVLSQDRRALLYGPPGSGKSTLARQLAQTLAERGHACCCLNADPGSPAFGVPGALSLASWQDGVWRVTAFEGLATLDAGRFRLPLVIAVQQLLRVAPEGVLLIDGPGVVRGIAGRELFTGLVEATAVDAVLVLAANTGHPVLPDECASLSARMFVVPAVAAAQRPGKRMRARRRTARWDAYLGDGVDHDIDLEQIAVTGTPPPITAAAAWTGRQVVLLQHDRTRAMGEVQRLSETQLTIRLPAVLPGFDTLLLRDAARNADGMIETAERFVTEPLAYLPPTDMLPPGGITSGPRPVGRVGTLDVVLINGVFGDPLLHVRQRHFGRSLLFDLGEGGRLGARIAHQVSDVFISHAHLDHIGGFLWLLRSRMGDFPPCRLYGPPGLAQHVAGFLRGIVWDRVGESGPVFDVAELHDKKLRRFRLQAGVASMQSLGEDSVIDGIIREEAGFRIRAVMLDHRRIPVLAYAYEPAAQLNIRKDRLTQRRLEPGPWLNALKQALLGGNDSVLVQLPDGSMTSAGELGAELVLISAGKKLVYATDFADSVENRRRLVALARHAHTLFCEATFAEADAAQAQRTGHLTARACAEIATAAGVTRLVPFHFSRRYEKDPGRIYDEIRSRCECLVEPPCAEVISQEGDQTCQSDTGSSTK